MIVIKEPTKAYIIGHEDKISQIKSQLSYLDKTADFEYKRFQKLKYENWYMLRYGDTYEEDLAERKEARTKCLLFNDESGLWIYSGLAPRVSRICRTEIKNEVSYPEYDIIPWAVVPSNKIRPYQQNGIDLLLKSKHGAVEIATGLGKSLMILQICKQIGLKTVVMVPTTNIADQMYFDFVKHLGTKYVGKYYGGKKQAEKLFVIGIGASLTRVEEGTKDWDILSKTQVFIADEGHTTPAKTLQYVCFGLLNSSPYRFFLSGTQMRNDGSDLLLEGIISPPLVRMSVKDGVDQGYLARPKFNVIEV